MMPEINAAGKIGKNAGVFVLTGLKDCHTGRCINIRLDGQGKAPAGWDAVCKPPKEQDYYYRYRAGIGYWPFGSEFNQTTEDYQVVKTAAEAVDGIKALLGGSYSQRGDSHPLNSDATAGLGQESSFEEEINAILEKYAHSGFGYGMRSKSYRSREKMDVLRARYGAGAGGYRFTVKHASVALSKIACKDEKICKARWPQNTCSEIVYDRLL